jgi:hypothetical protein
MFFFKKIRQLKIFKNGALTVEMSADTQILGIINLDPKKKYSDMRAPLIFIRNF